MPDNTRRGDNFCFISWFERMTRFLGLYIGKEQRNNAEIYFSNYI